MTDASGSKPAETQSPSESPAPNALDDEGRKHGPWQEHFGSGRVSAEGEYEHGVQQGVWRVWYRNGQLKAVGEYVDGRKVGVWRSYHPDGSLKQEKDHGPAPDAAPETGDA
jgi:antitoxin component YwqK of YwqJK toxin-antitoxin module